MIKNLSPQFSVGAIGRRLLYFACVLFMSAVSSSASEFQTTLPITIAAKITNSSSGLVNVSLEFVNDTGLEISLNLKAINSLGVSMSIQMPQVDGENQIKVFYAPLVSEATDEFSRSGMSSVVIAPKDSYKINVNLSESLNKVKEQYPDKAIYVKFVTSGIFADIEASSIPKFLNERKFWSNSILIK